MKGGWTLWMGPERFDVSAPDPSRRNRRDVSFHGLFLGYIEEIKRADHKTGQYLVAVLNRSGGMASRGQMRTLKWATIIIAKDAICAHKIVPKVMNRTLFTLMGVDQNPPARWERAR